MKQSAAGRALERKKLMADPVLVLTILALLVFLCLFIAYPLLTLMIESVYNGGRVSLDAFLRVLGMASFRGVITNTLRLGLVSGLLSTAIGFLFAYVDAYVKAPLQPVFRVVSVLPVVSPPFVLSLSCIMLFGRAGLVTRGLLGIMDANIQGFHGIVIVQVLTFFPVCYLMLKGLLKNIDPSTEESARNLGAAPFRVFWTVTLPLMLPGLGNAFLVTFIESVADFTNPMMIGGSYSTLATSIYMQVTGAYDITGAAAMAVLLLGLTMLLFILEKYWLERKTFTTLTGKASRPRQRITERRVTFPLSLLCAALTIFVIALYAMIPLGAAFKLWGRNYALVPDHFQYVFKVGFKALRDSLILSAIAAPITAILAMIIAYLVVKKKFRGWGLIEFVSMFAMAVPGTVLGIGYIRGFNRGLFGSGALAITGTGAILVLAFIVRSLPVGTRSGIAALQQIDRSIEESAYDLGAGSGKVFTSITLPLIKDSFFSGLVTAFVRSMTATSAVILLVSPAFQLITPQIMSQAEIGRFGPACAYATLLIAIVYGAIVLMNALMRCFGGSRRAAQ